MANEHAFVSAALTAWNSNLKTVDTFFSELSDEALDVEIAPGKNRLIYLLGHFASVHDRMIALLGVGERLHPELDALFLSARDREVVIPAASEIRRMYA
ncbi:MAG: DinB family protein, partial [Gemmatimonadaceae bacterium]